MEALPGSACSKAPTQEEELRRYWGNNSSTSLSHVLQTPPHALVALLCVGSVGCFSFACVQQQPFDASLSAVLVLLCVYIYTLQSDRCRAKSLLGTEFQGVSVISGDGHSMKPSASDRAKSADGMSELDLTGYARTLGVSIRNGAVANKGSTLNKILMDALAKEFLRCNAALRCYQNAFGPLPEDLPEETLDSVDTRPDPLSTSLKSGSLNLGMDLAGLADAGSAAPTPRSPAGLTGPPSPSPKRSHTKQASPRPASEASTSGPMHNVGSPTRNASSPVADNPDLLCTTAEWRLDELEQMRSEPQPPASPARKSFGLFGGR